MNKTITKKNKFLIYGLVLIASFSAGRFLSPKRVEVKEIEKTVYRDRESKAKNKSTNTQIRKIIKPDGTTIVEKIRKTDEHSSSESSRELDTEKQKQSVSVNQSQWSVGAYTDKQIFSGTIDKRLLGGVFFGVNPIYDSRTSELKGLLGIRLEF